MSAFLSVGTVASSAVLPGKLEPGYGQNDDGLQLPDYRSSPPQMAAWANALRDTDILWTRSSFPSGAAGGHVFDPAKQYWEWNFPPSGVQVRKVVSGIVKDANSSPVSGATVQLFNTATGLLVDTQTSATDGSYQCGDPNAVNCFAVGYLPGSPDTAGTTVDTLTGT